MGQVFCILGYGQRRVLVFRHVCRRQDISSFTVFDNYPMHFRAKTFERMRFSYGVLLVNYYNVQFGDDFVSQMLTE